MKIQMKDELNDEVILNLETSNGLTRSLYKALLEYETKRPFVSIDLGRTVIFRSCMWFTENVYHYRVSITRFSDFKKLTIRDKVGNINEEEAKG